VEMLSDGELVCREKIAGCLKRKWMFCFFYRMERSSLTKVWCDTGSETSTTSETWRNGLTPFRCIGFPARRRFRRPWWWCDMVQLVPVLSLFIHCNTDRKWVLLLQPCHEAREKRSHVGERVQLGFLIGLKWPCFGLGI
jgi:hypothetical protein